MLLNNSTNQKKTSSFNPDKVIVYQTWPMSGESMRWMNIKNRLWYLVAEKNIFILRPILWLMDVIANLNAKRYKE